MWEQRATGQGASTFFSFFNKKFFAEVNYITVSCTFASRLKWIVVCADGIVSWNLKLWNEESRTLSLVNWEFEIRLHRHSFIEVRCFPLATWEIAVGKFTVKFTLGYVRAATLLSVLCSRTDLGQENLWVWVICTFFRRATTNNHQTGRMENT